MYLFGQLLTDDLHFLDHKEHGVPIQVYLDSNHADIGFVEAVTKDFIKINNIYYNRTLFTFVSRPGY